MPTCTLTARARRWLPALALMLPASPAFAAAVGGGGAMPWDNLLTQIQGDITGVVVTAGIVIAIAVTGILWANGAGRFFESTARIVFGGAVAVGAATIFALFTGGGAGASF